MCEEEPNSFYHTGYYIPACSGRCRPTGGGTVFDSERTQYISSSRHQATSNKCVGGLSGFSFDTNSRAQKPLCDPRASLDISHILFFIVSFLFFIIISGLLLPPSLPPLPLISFSFFLFSFIRMCIVTLETGGSGLSEREEDVTHDGGTAHARGGDDVEDAVDIVTEVFLMKRRRRRREEREEREGGRCQITEAEQI